MTNRPILCGVDAYSTACGSAPLVKCMSQSSDGVGLYGWHMPKTREVHIPEIRELTLSVHLGGARRVRAHTESGLSRSFSRPGDITLIPAGKSIHYLTEGRVDFATVHFPLRAACAVNAHVGDALMTLSHCLFALRDSFVVSTVQTMMAAKSISSPDDERYLIKMLDALTWHLARVISEKRAEAVRLSTSTESLATSSNESQDFDALIKWIDANLSEKLTLEALADQAGMGRTRFTQKFSQQLGCPPHRYIMNRRIKKAHALIGQGELSVADIAYELGFSSQSHFSTTYKSLTGESPSDALGRACA